MNISRHWLRGEEVKHMRSPNHSGRFGAQLPDTIIIHYTGGRSAESSAKWLNQRKAKASAHVIIGKEGEIIQLVRMDTVAWHAGRSSWGERTGLNAYSIGIELDNPGRLERRAEGYYTWYGERVANTMVTEGTHRHEREPGYWHAFTAAQINTTEELCDLLMEKYPIQWILGHEEISPRRKVDPGPAFPLDKLRNNLLYQDRQHEDTQSFDDLMIDDAIHAVKVKTDLRATPKSDAAKISPSISEGTRVRVIDWQEDWVKVATEIEGWLSKKYLRI